MNTGTVNPADSMPTQSTSTAELKRSRFCILYKIVLSGMDLELPSLDVCMCVLNKASFTAKYKESAVAIYM